MKITDYGGNKVRRSHNRKNYGDLHGTISMRCLDCDKLRYVLPRELFRARMPRCLGCGGALEETDVARKRRDLVKKSKIATRRWDLLETAKASMKERCKACGNKMAFFETTRGFFHLNSNADCRKYYLEEGHFVEWNATRLIMGSDHIEKFGSRWMLVCLSEDGKEQIIGKFQRRMDAEEEQLNIFGPSQEVLEQISSCDKEERN